MLIYNASNQVTGVFNVRHRNPLLEIKDRDVFYDWVLDLPDGVETVQATYTPPSGSTFVPHIIGALVWVEGAVSPVEYEVALQQNVGGQWQDIVRMVIDTRAVESFKQITNEVIVSDSEEIRIVTTVHGSSGYRIAVGCEGIID